MKKILPVFATAGLLISACGEKDDRLQVGREAAMAQMRDPSSAEFRNERIRVMWSDQGDRKVVYCAEVNGNNAFGGKAGFRGFSYQFETFEKGVKVVDWRDGEGSFHESGSTNWYKECVREDTQRKTEGFRAREPEFAGNAQEAKEQVDESVPILSTKEAPPL